MKHLGKQSRKPIRELELIQWKGKDQWVTLHCREFTSMCPVTGQPDFGQIVIEYRPKKHLVETKSVKLYLWRFRNVKAFNEALVREIADDFYRQVKPEIVKVRGIFNPRGGIKVDTTAERPDLKTRFSCV